MALDPVSPPASAIAIAAGSITITGSIFGLQYEALLAGFFGGLCFVTYAPPATKGRLAASLLAASLMAGFFAPIILVGLLNYVSWLAQVNETALRIGVAAWIGLAGQSSLPFILSRVNKKIGG